MSNTPPPHGVQGRGSLKQAEVELGFEGIRSKDPEPTFKWGQGGKQPGLIFTKGLQLEPLSSYPNEITYSVKD